MRVKCDQCGEELLVEEKLCPHVVRAGCQKKTGKGEVCGGKLRLAI